MRLFIYFTLAICLTSCTKFDWHNPYDPECPKSLFTPTSLDVNMFDNNVRVTLEQKNNNISGFDLFRQTENETIIRLATLEKNVNSYVDISVVAGKKYKYSLIAVAGTNASDTIKKDILTIFTSTVSTQQVVELGPTFAKIKCNVLNSGEDSITARGITWSISPSPIVGNNKTSDGAGVGEYISLIEGLTPSTKYYARAYSENKRGISYGQEVSFVTQGLPIVLTTEVNNIQPASVSVLGRIVSDGGLPILQKGAVYSTTPNPVIETSNFILSTSSQTIFSVDLVDLTPSTKYYVRFFAKNAFGISYGEELSFSTESANILLSTAPIVNITGVSAESGGTISDNRGLPILSRGICWSKIPNPTVSNLKSVEDAGNNSYRSVITSLEINTLYYVRAYAQNKFGTFYGNEISFNSAYYLDGNGVVDVEGTRYKTIILGNQEWMAENLRVSRFQNGEVIEEINLIDQWRPQTSSFNKSLKGVINGYLSNFQQFGYIYNFRAANDIKGVCPVNFHIPSLAEWKELELFIGPDSAAYRLKAKQGWATNGNLINYNGDNLSGFNALPGGTRDYLGDNDGLFYTYFWTSSLPLYPYGLGQNRSIGESIGISENFPKISTYSADEFAGFRVRCVKNK